MVNRTHASERPNAHREDFAHNVHEAVLHKVLGGGAGQRLLQGVAQRVAQVHVRVLHSLQRRAQQQGRFPDEGRVLLAQQACTGADVLADSGSADIMAWQLHCSYGV